MSEPTTPELLRELARLAPRRCRWGTLRALDEDGNKEFDMEDTCFLRIDTPKPGPADGYVVGHGGHFKIESNDPMILWAVKEEIAERGWGYGIGRQAGAAHAILSGTGFHPDLNFAGENDQSEAYCLLFLLVEALRETATIKPMES